MQRLGWVKLRWLSQTICQCKESQIRVQEGWLTASQLWHYWILGWDSSLLRELSCALQGVQCHPWPLHTRCQQQPPVKTISRYCQVSLGDKIATGLTQRSLLGSMADHSLGLTGSFPTSLKEKSGHPGTFGKRTNQTSIWAISKGHTYLAHLSFKNKFA